MTVLIVDDHADSRAFLQHELERAGFIVRTAGSGEQALAAIASARPDAVLLDVVMPGIDGFETCVRIRRRDRDLPILFMTGLGETEHILEGFRSGGNDYVPKPVRASELAARLGAHTRTARLVRATRDAIDSSEQMMLAIDARGVLLWANTRMIGLADGLGPGYALAELGPLPSWLSPIEALLQDPSMLSIKAGPMTLHAQRLDEPNPSVCVVRLDAAPHEADGVRPPRPIDRMTARESEVLLWVTRGKTNRDIAEIIGISPRTVNKHLEHIFEKLGVETRTAAAAIASKMDLGKG
ncbi:MAG: response regulator [Burkholderiaceae bacterium]